MAALCAGVQYGLSSKGGFNENKDLIFVKLTDSALRAIEEYLRNKNKLNQNPTIQFLGNEGQLSFPSTHSNGSTSFNFSLSSTADMEGPGGSFECIQHLAQPRNTLEVMGAMSRKMHIRANEDVYEATRHRMAVAEENQKNKCTRVIKPNQTDIGRKVKVKQSGNRILPTPRRDILSSTTAKPLSNSYQPSSISSRPSNNGLGSNCVTSSRPPAKLSNVPNIMKRPIKERLIHLLALRPYKKPEIFDRVTRDGIRDTEKSCVITVLKQIASMRDNTYHLHRHLWNDVHDDWPFYSEQERQMLKRRKPQNLTPPGSSDGGSSGSGQSPTSTHPGSPPPPISSSTSVGTKRPGYYDGADGLPTKRPRISHYRKPAEIPRHQTTDVPRDPITTNSRTREPSSAYLSNGFGNVPVFDKRHYSDDEDDNANRKRISDNHSLSFGVNQEKTFKDNNCVSSPSKTPSNEEQKNKTIVVENKVLPRNRLDTRHKEKEHEMEKDREREREREQSRWNKVSSSTPNTVIATRVSPDSQTEPKEEIIRPVNETTSDETQFPDFLSKYTTINDLEQRRRYKADFNADYPEYRDLHAAVEKVSRRFAQLEERLKQQDQSSPAFREIKRQIFKEYQENKRDTQHQKTKQRFQYLHEKLSHIKRLVAEYDERQAGGSLY